MEPISIIKPAYLVFNKFTRNISNYLPTLQHEEVNLSHHTGLDMLACLFWH